MRRLVKIKSYVGIAIGLFAIVLFISDIIGYVYNPLDYERVYHIGSPGVKWRFQSGNNFIICNLILMLVALLYILLNILFLTRYKSSKRLKAILLCIEVTWVLWMAYSYYEWYLLGFDKVNPYK